MYYPLSTAAYCGAVCIRVRFNGLDGVETGTGVVIQHRGEDYLCTARHVLDDKYRPAMKRKNADIKSVEIIAQVTREESGKLRQKISKFPISLDTMTPFSFDNDAILVKLSPGILSVSDGFVINVCDSSSIITNEQWNGYRAGYPVSFVGYPSIAPKMTHTFRTGQEDISYPLLRQGVLATNPGLRFPINGTLGKSYSYLDSYALSGFSGAPIYAAREGHPDNGDGNLIVYKGYKPERLIGILCGHIGSTQDGLDGKHSGLSYFLPADLIRQQLDL